MKFHKLQAIFSLLPPIQRLEAVVGRLLLGGFILLTIGLGIGAYDLLRLNDSQAYRGDPKIVWSGVVWLLYLGLVIMRWKFAQGGRRFAIGAIGSFAFVLLTFWGSNLLSPLHNPRAPTAPKAPEQAAASLSMNLGRYGIGVAARLISSPSPLPSPSGRGSVAGLSFSFSSSSSIFRSSITRTTTRTRTTTMCVALELCHSSSLV